MCGNKCLTKDTKFIKNNRKSNTSSITFQITIKTLVTHSLRIAHIGVNMEVFLFDSQVILGIPLKIRVSQKRRRSSHSCPCRQQQGVFQETYVQHEISF